MDLNTNTLFEKNHNPKLILIRGVHGSGKTTFAKLILEKIPELKNACHYETDMYFIDTKTNEYKWNPNKIKEARQWCQEKVENCLKKEKNVVVSNTFCEKWELEPYFEIANRTNADITIFRMPQEHQLFENVHGILFSVIQKMMESFEDIPGEIILPTNY